LQASGEGFAYISSSVESLSSHTGSGSDALSMSVTTASASVSRYGSTSDNIPNSISTPISIQVVPSADSESRLMGSENSPVLNRVLSRPLVREPGKDAVVRAVSVRMRKSSAPHKPASPKALNVPTTHLENPSENNHDSSQSPSVDPVNDVFDPLALLSKAIAVFEFPPSAPDEIYIAPSDCLLIQ
jgi:hypothetical protein